jgi:hypothetical protein
MELIYTKSHSNRTHFLFNHTHACLYIKFSKYDIFQCNGIHLIILHTDKRSEWDIFPFSGPNLKHIGKSLIIIWFSLSIGVKPLTKNILPISVHLKNVYYFCAIYMFFEWGGNNTKKKISSYIPFCNDSKICNDQQHGN